MYGAEFRQFLDASPDQVLGELARYAGADIELNQTNAWQEQIRLLKTLELPAHLADTAKLYFEYTIPRLGRRVDVILIAGHVLFVIEFKVGERHFTGSALDQVWDYALDLKHFHEASHGLSIAPLLVATEAPQQSIQVQGTLHDYGLVRPLRASGIDLTAAVQHCLSFFEASGIEAHV